MKILFTAILKLIAIVVCLFLMPLGCSVVVHNMGERNDGHPGCHVVWK